MCQVAGRVCNQAEPGKGFNIPGLVFSSLILFNLLYWLAIIFLQSLKMEYSSGCISVGFQLENSICHSFLHRYLHDVLVTHVADADLFPSAQPASLSTNASYHFISQASIRMLASQLKHLVMVARFPLL